MSLSKVLITTKKLLRFSGVSLAQILCETCAQPVRIAGSVDFRSRKTLLRHITSGAVMPKSAKALARVCFDAATSRNRASRIASVSAFNTETEW